MPEAQYTYVRGRGMNRGMAQHVPDAGTLPAAQPRPIVWEVRPCSSNATAPRDPMRFARYAFVLSGATTLACKPPAPQPVTPAPVVEVAAQAPLPGVTTIADAQRYMADAEARLMALGIKANQAGWVASNFITEDTEALSAEANREYAVAVQQLATGARQFDGLELPAELRRKFMLLKLSLAAPPPADSAEAAELTKITSGLEADYGTGAYCRPAKPAARG